MPGPTLACLVALAAIFALTPFALYRLRHAFGMIPLWTYVGGSVLLMDFLSITVPILRAQIALTSVSLFPSLLTLALLLYLHAGTAETRRFIFTLVGVSLWWSLVCALIHGALESGNVQLFVSMPPHDFAEIVKVTPRSFVASAAALVVDLFLLLIAWQGLQNHTRLPFVVRAFLALGVTLFVDTTIYVFGAYWPAPYVPAMYAGDLLGKGISGAANAVMIWAYVRFVEPEAKTPEARGTLDILRVKERLEKAERALETSVQRYRQLFENVLDAVVVIRMGRIFDINKRAEELFGMSREDLQKASAGQLGLPAVTESFEVAKLRLKDGKQVMVEAAGVTVEMEGQEARMITIRDVSERERVAEIVRRKNRELEALNSVAQSGLSDRPLAESLAATVKRVAEVLGADSAALTLASPEGDRLRRVASVGLSPEGEKRGEDIRSGLLWTIFKGGKGVTDNALGKNELARRDLQEPGATVYATVAAPIVSRGRAIGTLSACAHHERTFSEDDAAIMETLAAQLGAVIDNARLIEGQRDQQGVMEILLAAATAFGRARRVEDLADALIESAALASGQAVVSLLIYDTERDILRLTAIAGVSEEAKKVLLGRTWGPKNEPARRLREGRATIVLTREEMQKYDAEATEAAGPAATVFTPLFQQEQFLGAIAVNFSDVLRIDARTISMLEGLAGLCAASLSNLNLWGVAERRAEIGTALLSAGQELASTRAPERVTRAAAAMAKTVLRTQAAWIWTAVAGRLRTEAALGGLGSLEGREIDARELFGGKLMDGGKPVALADAEAPDTSEDSRSTAKLLGARCALAAPLRLGERVVGAIAVGDGAPRVFAREDVTALETLATYTAVCLENARLLQDLSLSNEEIRDAQAQVVRSESLAAIGRLSAAIAHEVRNPLSGISAAAHALLKSVGQGASPTDVQLLKIIDRESKRLNRIITDFLLFARPRDPAPRRVALPALVEATLGLLEADMGGRVKVEREFAADLPPAMADGDQLKQVLINVLLNSIQAMPTGGAITVRGRAVEARGGPSVEVAVEDSGPGIPPADLTRVFEPFYSTKKEGTGLGLAIAHQIVTAHGGTITAHPAPGGGALFRIVIPAAQVPAATTPA